MQLRISSAVANSVGHLKGQREPAASLQENSLFRKNASLKFFFFKSVVHIRLVDREYSSMSEAHAAEQSAIHAAAKRYYYISSYPRARERMEHRFILRGKHFHMAKQKGACFMASLTVLTAKYRIPAKSLKRLYDEEGFEYEDDGFEIKKSHQKAINELNRKRMSPYVMAYALWCRDEVGPDEAFARYDNLVEIAEALGFSLSEALSEIHPKQVECDRLSAAKHWLDRAIGHPFDRDAVQRIATWCKLVLNTAPPLGVEYAYIAVRLLFSLSFEEMQAYPKHVLRAINLAVHYGFLDGCHSKMKDQDGTDRRIFHRPKFDL